MTVSEVKSEVMFQTNNDFDDLGDFLPYLNDYIDDGYDKLVYAWCQKHPTSDSEDWPKLRHDVDDTPRTPAWTHQALVDWATWLIYRNGNPQKQSRGYVFKTSFDEIVARIMAEGGANGIVSKIVNIPW